MTTSDFTSNMCLVNPIASNPVQQKMTPKESAQISVWLNANAKEILDTERGKLGLSQASYLEKLLEGTLPNQMEAKIEELRQEIERLRIEIETK